MTGLRVASISLIIGTIAFAQAQPNSQKPAEIELPLPITSPRAVLPGTIEPLTPKQKVGRTLRNMIAPQTIANRAIIAGWSHWTRDPEEWGGNPDAYGKRFANRMGITAVRESIQLGADVAFGLDPRYDRCDCTGFVSRSTHAWRRILVARKDNGSETIGVATLAGAYVTPFITDQWYPDRLNTWQNKWTSGSQSLAMRGVTNMLREFWPDVSGKLKLRRIKVD